MERHLQHFGRSVRFFLDITQQKHVFSCSLVVSFRWVAFRRFYALAMATLSVFVPLLIFFSVFFFVCDIHRRRGCVG